MQQKEQVALLRKCLELVVAGSTQLGERQGFSPISRYQDVAGFEREIERLFRRLPVPLVHASKIPGSGDFRVVETHRGSILVTRDDQGKVRAFHNVCRHRGTQLVNEDRGCAQRFVCPYHAWTYSSQGQLVGVPHGDSCFPELDREQSGLVPVRVEQRFGFLWAVADDIRFEEYFAGLEVELDGLGLESHQVFAEDRHLWRSNWKLVAEGGLESYHFRQAHKATIAPYFYDNLSIYDQFGPHFRSVLPKRNLDELKSLPEDEWRLRDYTHLTYALFPMMTLLVQADHVVWVHAKPLAVDQTEIAVITLVPSSEADRKDYWRTNHDITTATLKEDFALAESIQKGLVSGANQALTFGRNEAALPALQQVVESYTC